ncbi:DUF1801 domain-containing protein [Flavitalea antarctica]
MATKSSKKSAPPANEEQVSLIIEKLDSPLGKLVQKIRKAILETDPAIAEQVKWNSPAFYYTGDIKPFDPKEYKRDIVVINLHRGNPLLIFPTGATITDTTGLLEGNYSDGRRIVTVKDEKDFESKKDALQITIRQWLTQVEKP